MCNENFNNLQRLLLVSSMAFLYSIMFKTVPNLSIVAVNSKEFCSTDIAKL